MSVIQYLFVVYIYYHREQYGNWKYLTLVIQNQKQASLYQAMRTSNEFLQYGLHNDYVYNFEVLQCTLVRSEHINCLICISAFLSIHRGSLRRGSRTIFFKIAPRSRVIYCNLFDLYNNSLILLLRPESLYIPRFYMTQ